MSCCVSPESSPKLPSRQPAERLEEFQTSTEVSDDNTVSYLQHISDREVPDGMWFDFHYMHLSVTPGMSVYCEVDLQQGTFCDSRSAN